MMISNPKSGFVRLEAIRKAYGPVVALDNVTLDIEEGAFVTLLGPSGSGKTTCLRTIAGMLEPDSGSLFIAGRNVSRVPMNRRNIGMVFQNYSLFPHLSVAQNVAYPLRIRGVEPREAAHRVGEALEMVRLDQFGDRRPEHLSGGQQQRVALARALVFVPDLVLLDEPLSALDRVLREEMQLELRRIHRETGTTMICVTHDRSEALAMSDRVVVMRNGAVVQDSDPTSIYLGSASRFVAEFLGEVNIFPMTVETATGNARDEIGRVLPLPADTKPQTEKVDIVVRSEFIRLRQAVANEPDPQAWVGTVTEAMFLGDAVRFVIDCSPHRIMARLPLECAKGLSAGSKVEIDLCQQPPMVFARRSIVQTV